jgi:hypothetical protein
MDKFNEAYEAVIANQPDWITFEGVKVLKVKNSRFIGVPFSNRKNSRKFGVLDLNSRDDYCTILNNNEIGG